MPNIKSAIKRVSLAEIRRKKNFSTKSSLKTYIKRFEQAVEGSNIEEAKTALAQAIRALDKAASAGVIHKNMAARKKSKLTKKFNNMAS